MAVELADAYISLVPSAKGLASKLTAELGDLDGVGRTGGDQAATGFMGKFKAGLVGIAGAVGGAFAAAKIGQIVKDSIGAASDMNETVSKVGVIFGDVSGDVEAFADTSATTFGQSKQQALDAAATFATFGKSAGLTGKDLAGFSTGLVGTSADLASFFNTSPEEAITAIGAALRGESEPIRQYGVLLDDATLRNRALKLGLIATTKDALTPQQKVLAAQAEILAQTGDAQGDFARTSDGAANKQKILSAQAANASAEFGSALLPAYAAIVTILSEKVVPIITKVSEWMTKHKTTTTVIAGVIAGVLVAAFVAWAISAAAAAVATLAAAAPFIAIGLAIAALAAGIIYAYTHFDWFRAIIDTVWQVLQTVFNWVTDHWPLLLAVLLGPFGVAILVVVKNFDTIKAAVMGVWDWISEHWPLLLAIITGPIGLAVLAIIKNWDSIKDTFTSVKDWIWGKINDIVGFFTAIPGRIWASITWIGDSIRNGIDAARDFVWRTLDAIVGYFLGLPGRLAGAFSGMFDGIYNAFRSAINYVIDGWNSLRFGIPEFDTHIPGLGKVGGGSVGTVRIPRLAEGGAFSAATMAIIGENSSRSNPEIAAPQSAIRDAVADALQGFRGGVTVNAVTMADAHDIAREVAWQQKTAGV